MRINLLHILSWLCTASNVSVTYSWTSIYIADKLLGLHWYWNLQVLVHMFSGYNSSSKVCRGLRHDWRTYAQWRIWIPEDATLCAHVCVHTCMHMCRGGEPMQHWAALYMYTVNKCGLGGNFRGLGYNYGLQRCCLCKQIRRSGEVT